VLTLQLPPNPTSIEFCAKTGGSRHFFIAA
jgi:hypothetical protein